MRVLWLIGLALALSACADDGVDARYGSSCQVTQTCRDLEYVDCGAAVDGPAYYYNAATHREISKCGGFCFTQDPAQLEECRTMCPPPAWTCSP